MAGPGERVGTVQPGLVTTPTVSGGENAMERLQKAFEAGIFNYNEIADGLTVKPLARKAKAGELEATLAKQKADRSNRTIREEIERNLLDSAKAQSGFDAAVTKARTGFHTPADIAELGRLGAAGDVLDAEGNALSKEALVRKAHDFLNDPEGLKQYYRESTLKLGGSVDPGMNLDQLKLAFSNALNKSDERSVQKMRLEAMLDRFTKGGESSLKLESDLRKEFYGNERVSIFNKTAPMYSKIRSFVEKAGRGEEITSADDMGIIFSYMKILDPGSTVREGEYATAEQTRGIPEHVVALYNKLWTGQKLTPEQRQNFAAAAETAFSPHKQMYDALRKDFSDLATRSGIEPRAVVGSDMAVESVQPGGPVENPPAPAKKPATNDALPPGVSYLRLKDGRVVKAQKLPDGTYRVLR